VGQAIGNMLPSAVGVAVSPLPIVAVILMLLTERGRVNGPMFVVGWCVGLAVVGAIALTLSSSAGATTEGAPSTWVSWLKLVLGLLLLLVAARQWRGRPHGADEPPTPKWMGALDSFTPGKATVAGIVLSALNPKNLLLAVASAATIAAAGISTGEEVVAYVVFVAIASIGVGLPVVVYFALGEGSRDLLDRLRTWFAFNNAVIMAVLLLVIGVKLIGDAIAGFSS
jgi:threonine/homoserine/homoserine lactone efflux protein